MSKLTPYDKRALKRVCPELKQLLNAELENGNVVSETCDRWAGWLLIWLEKPFVCSPSSLPTGVQYNEFNDPAYWKAEYVYEMAKQKLVCKFGLLDTFQ